MLTRKRSALILRIYHPDGSEYPRDRLIVPGGVYIATPSAVFTAVKIENWPRRQFWSDGSWLYPEEIRVLASIALAIPEGCGAAVFLPHWETREISSSEAVRFQSRHLQTRLTTTAEELVQTTYGTKRYQLRDVESSGLPFAKALAAAINVRDDLLIRGLYTLLKGWSLLRPVSARSLIEEAFMNVQISREAALELIREVLRYNGHKSAGFKEAHEYLEANFRLGDHLARYFREQHELWIEMKHPNSQFGPVWTPRMMADDFYDTYSALVSVYRHLLTGEPGRATACFGFESE